MIHTSSPTLVEITEAGAEILRKAEELPGLSAGQPDDFGEMIDAIRSASGTLNQRLAEFAKAAGENAIMDKETRHDLRGNLTAIMGFSELMLALTEGERQTFHVTLDDIRIRGRAFTEMLDQSANVAA